MPACGNEGCIPRNPVVVLFEPVGRRAIGKLRRGMAFVMPSSSARRASIPGSGGAGNSGRPRESPISCRSGSSAVRLPFLELLLTAVLAAGFATVGEAVLRRRIRDLAGANEAMLVGMGVCAAALFPLSLALPRRALLAEAVGIFGALAFSVVARFRDRRPAARPDRGVRLRPGGASGARGHRPGLGGLRGP